MCLRTPTWLRKAGNDKRSGWTSEESEKKHQYMPGKSDWAVLSDTEVSQNQDE